MPVQTRSQRLEQRRLQQFRASFIRLPAELRLMVYRLHFGHVRLENTTESRGFDTIYWVSGGQTTHIYPGCRNHHLLSLLRTNRLIYAEAFPVLLSSFLIVFGGTGLTTYPLERATLFVRKVQFIEIELERVVQLRVKDLPSAKVLIISITYNAIHLPHTAEGREEVIT